MRKEKNPTAGRYRAFVYEFAKRADQLVDRALINQHICVLHFLQAFSDKIGNKLCKRCKIDIEDPTTTTGKWNNIRKEALKVSTKDDSQMSRLWKVNISKNVFSAYLAYPAYSAHKPNKPNKPCHPN